jgi:hypothetical protein
MVRQLGALVSCLRDRTPSRPRSGRFAIQRIRGQAASVLLLFAFSCATAPKSLAQIATASTSPTPSPAPRAEATHRPGEQAPGSTPAPPQPARIEHHANENGTPAPATTQGSGTAKADVTHRSPESSPGAEASPQRYMQNLHRWQNLSPEEREALRKQQRYNQEQREKSLNEAYQRSGLRLNDEQRQVFRKRYVQERKKMEEQLLHDIQEKRQAGNAAIIEQLKKEFAATQNPGSSPANR